MSSREVLEQAAQRVGIAPSHYDIDGHLIYASDESLAYFTELLQPPSLENKDGIFDDVIVIKESEPISYFPNSLHSVSNETQSAVFSAQLFDENGQSLSEQTVSFDKPFSFPSLPFGYYTLHFSSANLAYRVRLLVRPQTAYQPPLFNEKKAWGLNVQLYSVRSQKNWGMGDFADLRTLIEQGVRYGADFVGVNPLHLHYGTAPQYASPYSSASRRWLNYLYIAVEQLPEFSLCKSVQNWFNQDEIQKEVAHLRAGDLVDYPAVNRLKTTALEQLFAYFQRAKSAQIVERRKEFADFVKKEGEALQQLGLFCVLDQEAHTQSPDENKVGWLGWCEEWQSMTAKTRQAMIKKYQSKISFYAWLQWVAQTQLAELQQLCRDSGMKLGIYGDLAVSSSRGSADVWTDPELFCLKASVGAPPDPLGPVGQNWNIPPYNPSVLKARGFQPFIDLLRANMQFFGVLRIDHIMGLFRLWLIPEGKTAADGVYVHYPFDALMSILAIESQRNQCLVVGEDLGTVPDEVRWKLDEFSVFSYFVLYFEQKHHQFPQGKDFPRKAFATIGTHDVPSLQSFWHCRDLELFGALGVLQGDALKAKYDQRVIDKQALLNTLHRDHYLPSDYWGDALSMAMHGHLNWVLHQYLANSNSSLIGVQLENLLSQEVSFNLPGTSQEYPNWQHKLAWDLDEMFNNDHIQAFLNHINHARK